MKTLLLISRPKTYSDKMNKFRSFVLPIAIVLGLLLHEYCAMFTPYVPILIFAMLLLNFAAVDVKKLKITMLDVWLMLFQIVVSMGCYWLVILVSGSDIIAEGILVGVLCPVASSVVVISCMLGANRETVTTYTILGNLMVAIVAPIYFSFIGQQQDMPFFESLWLILKRVSPIIALPFVLALCMQHWLPKINGFLCKIKGASFYLWALALLFTLGQTIDFMFLHGRENIDSIIALGIASVIFCAIQFGFGKWLGGKYGDRMAGGQLLGQKNTAMGIWIANTYLNPLASVFPALYSIWQNLFNSWQMWKKGKEEQKKDVN
ncbi:MAG: transporter [Bacteroidales bacterium]|nr:transporter [Bacteroidales bacterium]